MVHAGLQNAASQYSDHNLLMAFQQLVSIAHKSCSFQAESAWAMKGMEDVIHQAASHLAVTHLCAAHYKMAEGFCVLLLLPHYLMKPTAASICQIACLTWLVLLWDSDLTEPAKPSLPLHQTCLL